MNFFCSKTTLIFVTFLFLIFSPVFAQQTAEISKDSTSLFNLVSKTYGSDQVLMNGIYHENYYRNALGHSFLMEDQFYRGYIVIHNKRYNDVDLKYNVFDQNIVIFQKSNSGNPTEFIPPNDFISEFRIDDKFFRKYKDEEGNEKFYQVVYDGIIKCLYYWTKERVESFQNSRTRSYRFNNAIKKTYLLIGKMPYKYKSTGSFLNLFPKELKPEINSFCRNEKINPAKATEPATGKLINYCEKLLEQNQKANSGQPK